MYIYIYTYVWWYMLYVKYMQTCSTAYSIIYIYIYASLITFIRQQHVTL